MSATMIVGHCGPKMSITMPTLDDLIRTLPHPSDIDEPVWCEYCEEWYVPEVTA